MGWGKKGSPADADLADLVKVTGPATRPSWPKNAGAVLGRKGSVHLRSGPRMTRPWNWKK